MSRAALPVSDKASQVAAQNTPTWMDRPRWGNAPKCLFKAKPADACASQRAILNDEPTVVEVNLTTDQWNDRPMERPTKGTTDQGNDRPIGTADQWTNKVGIITDPDTCNVYSNLEKYTKVYCKYWQVYFKYLQSTSEYLQSILEYL